ncbi:MAG: hypothetical protein NUV94_06560 [Candidatus Acetothermia bacterium]|nr:hypothetical protein [Candidatus Acetothermia bacterium]
MGKLLVVLLVAIPVLGAEIAFVPPPAVRGAFQVEVTGCPCPADPGQVTILNLRTGEMLQVPLAVEEGKLVTAKVQVLRPCDPPAEGPALRECAVGDVVVAATDLCGGLSATAQVAPREPGEGEPKVHMKRYDNETLAWEHTDRVVSGLLRVVVEDASGDRSCEPDAVELRLHVGEKGIPIRAEEDGIASGRFVYELVGVVEPRECGLWLRLLTPGDQPLAEVPIQPGAVLSLTYGEVTQTYALDLVPVVLRAPSALRQGCGGEVAVTEPADPEEVRWCLNGTGVECKEPSLPIAASPGQARLTATALVRAGPRWGIATAEIPVLPRVELALVDAATGLPVYEPWPYDRALRVQVKHAWGEPKALLGRLGPDPLIWEVEWEDEKDGTLWSVPFTPQERGMCPGDVLWVQYRDPIASTCYPVYRVLGVG